MAGSGERIMASFTAENTVELLEQVIERRIDSMEEKVSDMQRKEIVRMMSVVTLAQLQSLLPAMEQLKEEMAIKLAGKMRRMVEVLAGKLGVDVDPE